MTEKISSVWPIDPGHVLVEGEVPTTRRTLSGLYGLDGALAGPDGSRGVPLRGGLEIFGRWETGKSTLGYFLAGRVPLSRRIVLVDLEGGAREDYLQSAVSKSGFSGTVYRIPFNDGDVPRSHEDMLQEGADALLEEGTGCVILDSAAMTTPLPEREGEMEEEFMGRRAKVLAKFVRKAINWINAAKEDKLLIIVNHMLMDMQGYGKMSPGGDTMKFGIFARLWIHRTEDLGVGAFEAEVVVDKLRFGGRSKDKKAKIIIVPGVGVSPELTAVFDCMELKRARRQAGTGIVQYLKGEDWTSVGRLSALIDEVRKNGKAETFQPFYDILSEQ